MKQLMGLHPEQFAAWVLQGTNVTNARGGLKQDFEVTLYADGLVWALVEGQPVLLHFEYQSTNDPRMPERLQKYNIIASTEHDYLPVYSYVIYLKDNGPVKQPPFIKNFPNGEQIHRFNYKCIELYKITAQEVLDSGLLVLLAFLPLTKGGKEPDNIEQMIERLIAANEIDLLAVSYPLGGLVFDKEPEREWFKRRFKMLQDVLKDSWVYQELIEEGLEKGRQQELEHQKQILLDIVASRFPEIASRVERQMLNIDDLAILRPLFVQVSLAQNAQEVMQLFGSANDDEQH
jgi:predicted transposase YdaD